MAPLPSQFVLFYGYAAWDGAAGDRDSAADLVISLTVKLHTGSRIANFQNATLLGSILLYDDNIPTFLAGWHN